MAEPDDREALQEELKKADAAVAALEHLAEDDDLLAVLEARRSKRDAVSAKLRAARPIKSQLRAA